MRAMAMPGNEWFEYWLEGDPDPEVVKAFKAAEAVLQKFLQPDAGHESFLD